MIIICFQCVSSGRQGGCRRRRADACRCPHNSGTPCSRHLHQYKEQELLQRKRTLPIRSKYNFWTFRPKATLSYNVLHGMNLRYTFEMKDRSSRIAMINDATIQTNSMEMTIGKPDLKPSRDTEHTLRLSHNTQRWSTYINGLFRHCNKPNMAHYERTTDDKLIYTQINQKAIDLLHLSVYASYWILPNTIHLTKQSTSEMPTMALLSRTNTCKLFVFFIVVWHGHNKYRKKIFAELLLL